MKQQERIERRGGLLRAVESDAQLAAGEQVKHPDGERILQVRILVPQLEQISAIEHVAQPQVGRRLGRDADRPPDRYEEEQRPPKR